MGELAPTLKDDARGVASLALLCELADEIGHPSGALLTAAGVSRQALSDPLTTVTARQELAAIDALLSADPTEAAVLGLRAGVRYQLTTYGIWSFALLSSPTVRDAFEIALAHIALTYACTTIFATETETSLLLGFDDWPVAEPLRRFALARDSIAALGIIRGTLEADMRPLEVQLAMSAPQEPRAFDDAYGVPVVFGASATVMSFERGLLDRPMPQASELTAQMCLAQCRELLDARSARRGLSGRVRDRLLQDPRRMPGQEEVASELHMSVRNLRRQLTGEGVNFRELVEQTRRGLAEELLLTDGLTVDQVAYRVGYADTSAFVHAFRRWNGDAPRRWAQRNKVVRMTSD